MAPTATSYTFLDGSRRSSNRFQPLADMPDHDASDSSTATVVAPKKRTSPRNHARRKFAKRASSGARANVAEALDIAHSDMTLPSDRLPRRNRGGSPSDGEDEIEVWHADNEVVESYEPHLEIMLPGDITLDNLPRPSPPFTIRVKAKAVKREKHTPEDDDWDVVSNASEESFYMV